MCLQFPFKNVQRMFYGSLFHDAGPAYEKARSLNLVWNLGRQQFVVFPDCRPDRVTVAVTVLTRSVMYFETVLVSEHSN